jgi:3-hydroxybutyryl-CoA dehydrogenase
MEADGTPALVAVFGAGIMGTGIAQLAAMAGYEVRLFDAKTEQVRRAISDVAKSLGKLAAKGTLDPEAVQPVLHRIRPKTDLADAACDADVVIEAVVESLPVKQQLLAAAVEVAKPEAILGTNTSQLSITAIGSGCGRAADRVIGLHFFNPPVLMRLVEIVCGLQTNEDVVERADEFARSLGKETVVCRKDSPGFLTSRISAIVRIECLRMVEEGVGTPEDIDRALRLGLNFPIGPLELGDRNGLDTFLLVLESLSSTLGERFLPTVGLRNLVAAGRLGRKSGHGIYRYDDKGVMVASEPG